MQNEIIQASQPLGPIHGSNPIIKTADRAVKLLMNLRFCLEVLSSCEEESKLCMTA